MTFRVMRLALLLAGLALPTLDAQVPTALGPLEPATALSADIRRAIAAKAPTYPLVGFRNFGRDSILLVFEDSTLTGAALSAHSWMFGPPVTAAEADSCPPEKVLGRKIARAFWNAAGRPRETQSIMIAVRGTHGIDQWTVETMYYMHDQLDNPWAGDPTDR